MTTYGALAVTFAEPYDPAAAAGGKAASSPEVPGLYPVAVAGHPYLVDLKAQAFSHASIPTLRPFAVAADTLGEKNINPESLWRASQNSWHKGAGQTHLDRADSDPARFRSSKGVNPWTRWRLTLLPDTTQARASGNSNLRLAVAGTDLYIADGNALLYTTDLTAFTTVTGTPVAAVTGLASDGYTVYAGYTGQGVWSTTRGAAAATQMVTGTSTPSAIGYVKGRLMVAVGNALYNVTAAGALPTALFTHPNSDWAWVGFAEGPNAIYVAGFSGDKSLIYRTAVKADGTGLDAVIPAGQLPDGEIVRAIGAYLGFVLIGTDKGLRIAVAGSSGDLQIGPLLTTGPCRCFEGQDRFVWFGWDNYDTTSTGLGRFDLTVLTDNMTPAYASDLMVTGQGQVADVATFGGKRVFAVEGLGIYTESTNLVPNGQVDSGLITYDLSDNKVALYLDVRHVEPLLGTHNAYISTDEGPFLLVGGHTAGDPEGPFTISEYEGESFEIREQLFRDTDPTLGPTLLRHTLLSNPAVLTGYFLTVPLLLTEKDLVAGQERGRRPADELAYLKGLRDSKQRVLYQECAATFSVTVEDIDWRPTHPTVNGDGFNGTCVVKLKTI